MKNTVTLDCFPESAARYRRGYTVVAVDVVRATTVGDYRGCDRAPMFSGDVKAAQELASIPRAPPQMGRKVTVRSGILTVNKKIPPPEVIGMIKAQANDHLKNEPPPV